MFFRILALLGPFAHFALGATYQVSVGNSQTGQAVFDPPTIKANVNDSVAFIFNGRHTVTQTAFSAPCLNNSAASTFDSGFLDHGANFSIDVFTSGPIWIRCSSHCTHGMVAAINAPDSGNNTFQDFQARANGTYVASTSSHSATSTSPSTTPTTSRGAADLRFAADHHVVLVVSSLFAFMLAALNL